MKLKKGEGCERASKACWNRPLEAVQELNTVYCFVMYADLASSRTFCINRLLMLYLVPSICQSLNELLLVKYLELTRFLV